jgi:hypothetical protein
MLVRSLFTATPCSLMYVVNEGLARRDPRKLTE